MLRNRLPHHHKGQGLLEFALVLPLLLLLVYGIIELGRLIWIYSMTLTTSREAARYGSAAGDIGGMIEHYRDCDGIRSAGFRVGSLAGVDPANILIDYDNGTPSGSLTNRCPAGAYGPDNIHLGDRVIVQVKADYEPILPLVNFPPFTISSRTARTIIKDVNIKGTPPPPVSVTPTLHFDSNASADEIEGNANTLHIPIRLDTPSSLNVTVEFEYLGTATFGSDYTAPTSLTIPAGSTIGYLNVTIVNDGIYEGPESVTISIKAATNGIIGSPSDHIFNIIDDEGPPYVYFEIESQSTPEDSGPSGPSSHTVAVNLVVNPPTVYQVTVPFSFDPTSSATAGSDYTPVTTSPVIIPPLTSHYAVNVTINRDTLDEPDTESVVLAIGAPTNASPGTPNKHTIYIEDNDTPPQVFFALPSSSASESQGNSQIEVRLSAASGKTVQIGFRDISPTGTATPGSDYSLMSSPLLIPPGITSGFIQMNLVKDTDDTEPDETVILTLQNPVDATIGNPSQHTVTITNRTVNFALDAQTVPENIGLVTVVAELNTAATQDVTVPFSLSGTASQSLDYNNVVPASGEVLIPAGQTMGTTTLHIIDDTLYEETEEILVTMGQPSNAARVAPTLHTIYIVDNDSAPAVYFQQSSQTVSEGVGYTNIAINLSAASGMTVTVPYGVSGTALSGIDFSLAPSPIVIPAGSTSVNLRLDIIDDSMDEDAETLTVGLQPPINATLGGPKNHTVTITDNDGPPAVYFTLDTQSAYEDSGSMNVGVRLATASGKPVSVPITVSGTALAPEDYALYVNNQPFNGTLNFAPGVSLLVIEIRLVDDTMYEAEETVIFDIGTPTNATVGSPSRHTARIQDNDKIDCNAVYTIGPVVVDKTANQLRTTMTNGSQVDVTIARIDLNWTDPDPLDWIRFNNNTIWDGSMLPIASVPTITQPWTAADRTLYGNATSVPLVFQINGKLKTFEGLTIVLSNNCVISKEP